MDSPLRAPPHLKEVIVELRPMFEWNWTINLTYAKRATCLVAAVLAELHHDQSQSTMIHCRPPDRIQTALDLDEAAIKLEKKLRREIADRE